MRPIDELADVAGEIRQLEARQRWLVARALAEGASWSDIGRQLGVARQSAHSRFRGLTPGVVGEALEGVGAP